MECPICYNIIRNSCIGSCTHHFCLECLIQWCENNGTKCPICKTLIKEIRPDIEFNNLNCPNSTNICMDNLNNKVVVNFSNNEKAGITLENNFMIKSNMQSPGVRVKKIDQKDNCYKAGLRKGDIILFINNVPCINHKQSVDIIDKCVLNNTLLICILFKI